MNAGLPEEYLSAFQHRSLPYAAFLVRRDGRGFIWNWGLESVYTPVGATFIDTLTFYPTTWLYQQSLLTSYDKIEPGGIPW